MARQIGVQTKQRLICWEHLVWIMPSTKLWNFDEEFARSESKGPNYSFSYVFLQCLNKFQMLQTKGSKAWKFSKIAFTHSLPPSASSLDCDFQEDQFGRGHWCIMKTVGLYSKTEINCDQLRPSKSKLWKIPEQKTFLITFPHFRSYVWRQ